MALKYNSVGKYFELTGPIPPSGKRRLTTNNNCCCQPCCEVPEGANTYSCSEVRPATCTGRGGTVPAGATSCSPDPCCNGACCFGTSCQYLADVKCTEMGGVFKGCGTTCGPGVCGEQCPPGQVRVNGQCLSTCESSGNGCPEGFSCCSLHVDIQNGAWVIENVCLPLEAGPVGRCCFNFGGNCVDTFFGACLCTFPIPYNGEVTWTAGETCEDGCNPLP